MNKIEIFLILNQKWHSVFKKGTSNAIYTVQNIILMGKRFAKQTLWNWNSFNESVVSCVPYVECCSWLGLMFQMFIILLQKEQMFASHALDWMRILGTRNTHTRAETTIRSTQENTSIQQQLNFIYYITYKYKWTTKHLFLFVLGCKREHDF